jgi:uncharacterized protein YukJ
MSHHHTKPLKPPPAAAHRLPKNTYGAIVGKVEGPLSDADDNHVFIPVRVMAGPNSGLFRLAFNTESTDDNPDQYFVRDEAITMADAPTAGFTGDASLSYSAIGLKQADFTPVDNGKLRMLVHDSALQADLVAAYGMTFSDGGGVHDIHYNNGEPTGSHFHNSPNHDGALVFYYLTQSGQPYRRWFFIKFDTQSLP